MLNHLKHLARSHPWYLIALAISAVINLALVSPQPATSQDVPPSALASQFFTAMNGQAPAYMFSPNATLHTPEGTFRGMTSAAKFGETLGASFSDLEFETRATASASNDTVMVSFTLTGTNTGSYHGLDATCAGIAVDGIALLELEAHEVIPHAWYRTPWEMRESPPPTETQLLVTNLWVTYDSAEIERQIAESNTLDPATQPGCGDDRSSGDSWIDPMPDCLARNVCQLP